MSSVFRVQYVLPALFSCRQLWVITLPLETVRVKDGTGHGEEVGLVAARVELDRDDAVRQVAGDAGRERDQVGEVLGVLAVLLEELVLGLHHPLERLIRADRA